MDNPLIITCPVIGAELTRKVYPYLPLTPDEIADSAAEAVGAGASIIHLHVRDDDGNPTQRVDVFGEVTDKIRDRCDCIIQYSTGGAIGTSVEDRCHPLALHPEMATLSMGTMNFCADVFENNEETIRTIASTAQANGVALELEIFDYGMLDTTYRFLDKKFIPEIFHINFILGVPGGMSGEIENLLFLVNGIEPDQTWSVGGMGKYQLSLATHAIAMGGHVRVGIEDNIYYRKGELAKSNSQLIERVVNISRELDRPIATPRQAKEILRLFI